MRYATLITGLVTQRVHRTDHARYYHLPQMPLLASDGALLAATEEFTVTERVVPITQFCKDGSPDLYIAYSEEVEELLAMPFRTILREKESAIAELNRLRSLSAWEHIKAAYRLLISRMTSSAK